MSIVSFDVVAVVVENVFPVVVVISTWACVVFDDDYDYYDCDHPLNYCR
jgi:hypothetical protein